MCCAGLQNNRGKKPTEQASSQELVELLQGPKRRIESRAASSQPSAQRLAANPASTRSRAQALEHNTQCVTLPLYAGLPPHALNCSLYRDVSRLG